MGKLLRVILGDQLFPVQLISGEKNNEIFMAERQEFCRIDNSNVAYDQHKQKITLFFAAMRSYRDELQQASYQIQYYRVDEKRGLNFISLLLQYVSEHAIRQVVTWRIHDRLFRQEFQDTLVNAGVQVNFEDSPGFLTNEKELDLWFEKRKSIRMSEFYKWQRQRLGILLEQEVGQDGQIYNQPQGGQWSYDEENRKALPVTLEPPEAYMSEPTQHVQEVVEIVNKLFVNNPGNLNAFYWPTTRAEALVLLDNFLKQRFENFGPYQDALSQRSKTVFHSLLSPLINCGLLTPDEVLKAALKYEGKVPISSLEGFVRQLIGWREFVNGINLRFAKEQWERNHFNHHHQLSDAWYSGETGLPALDELIHKAQDTGYAHHIERLMVAGNVMLLAGIHPHAAHRWFMEMFIDSAEWVMGPNVFGMALFSDGGIFATKPYCCGSNYWKKQAGSEAKNWTKTYGKEWADGLDGLYWNFIKKNEAEFNKNHRTQRMTWGLKRLGEERKHKLMRAAEFLLQELVSDKISKDFFVLTN